jgi:hypothetical protein
VLWIVEVDLKGVSVDYERREEAEKKLEALEKDIVELGLILGL